MPNKIKYKIYYAFPSFLLHSVFVRCSTKALLLPLALSLFGALPEAFACPLTPTVKVKREPKRERERESARERAAAQGARIAVMPLGVVVIIYEITGIELRLACDVVSSMYKLFGCRSAKKKKGS